MTDAITALIVVFAVAVAADAATGARATPTTPTTAAADAKRAFICCLILSCPFYFLYFMNELSRIDVY
jgi:hypothetical protein